MVKSLRNLIFQSAGSISRSRVMLPLLMLLLRSKDFHMIRTEKEDGKSTLVLNKKLRNHYGERKHSLPQQHDRQAARNPGNSFLSVLCFEYILTQKLFNYTYSMNLTRGAKLEKAPPVRCQTISTLLRRTSERKGETEPSSSGKYLLFELKILI